MLPGNFEGSKLVAETQAQAAPAVSSTTIVRSDPIQILRDGDTMFDSSADEHGFTDYWTSVAPKQNELGRRSGW